MERQEETVVNSPEGYARKHEREVKEIFDYLITVLGRMGNHSKNQETVLKVFSTTHRTLQQEVMRSLIMPILKELAKNYETGSYDGRNEDSARLASQMLAAVPEEDIYLPYI